jgi:hypothetical protein
MRRAGPAGIGVLEAMGEREPRRQGWARHPGESSDVTADPGGSKPAARLKSPRRLECCASADKIGGSVASTTHELDEWCFGIDDCLANRRQD